MIDTCAEFVSDRSISMRCANCGWWESSHDPSLRDPPETDCTRCPFCDARFTKGRRGQQMADAIGHMARQCTDEYAAATGAVYGLLMEMGHIT